MNLDQLNDLILLRIFSYLSVPDLARSAQVCRNWSRLSLEALERTRNKTIRTILVKIDNEIAAVSNPKKLLVSRSVCARLTNIELDAVNYSMKPSFGLFVMSVDADQIVDNDSDESEGYVNLASNKRVKRTTSPRQKKKKYKFQNEIAKLVPRGAHCLVIMSNGLIGIIC